VLVVDLAVDDQRLLVQGQGPPGVSLRRLHDGEVVQGGGDALPGPDLSEDRQPLLEPGPGSREVTLLEQRHGRAVDGVGRR
jgi:hypothetical protein